VLGRDFTLLKVGGGAVDTSRIEQAFQELGVPIDVVEISDEHLASLLERRLFILRPDLHVAWRGNEPPGDPGRLAATAVGLTGRLPARERAPEARPRERGDMGDDEASKVEIKEILHRYCRAVDRADRELFRSIYHPDAIEHHGNFEGLGLDFVDVALGRAGGVELWQHHLTTINIDVDGDVAYSEAYYISSSVFLPDADGNREMWDLFGRYVDRFERRQGEWKIAERLCVRDFRHDRVIGPPLSKENHIQGTKDSSDPSYWPGFSKNPVTATTSAAGRQGAIHE
jgi:SnoaL-like domain